MPYEILMVEDDKRIMEIVQDYFQTKSENQWKLSCAVDGDAGMAMLYEREFDLVLLDVMLPGTDGFELCKYIRRNMDTPIIFITARGNEEDRLYGYHLGCDDYVVKPFSVGELYAKVQALLRRAKGMMREEILSSGDVKLYLNQYMVCVGKEKLELPPKEFALLKYFLEHKNQVARREELLIKIWGYDYEGNDRVVDNHVKKLRKALGNCGSSIKTVMTKGYRWEEKSDEE